jgi:hypothetical protein
MKKSLIILLTLLAMIGCSNANDKEQFIGSTSSTILGDEASGVTLTAITVQPGNSSIAQSTTQNYTATGIYSDNSNKDITSAVTWSTGSASIATNSSNVVTGVSAGTTTVVASAGNISGNATISVTNATLESIRLEWVSSMGVGTTMQLIALGVYSDGVVRDITHLVDWNSGTTGVASISNSTGTKGLATGSSAGTTSVTASLNGVVSPSKNLVVTGANLTGISIGADASIPKGTKKTYVAIATYADGTVQNVSASAVWSSSNTSSASISLNGTTSASATGIEVGNTVISASLNGITATANLAVTSATVVSLAITGTGNGTVAKGTNIPLKAIATLSDGSTLDVTNVVSWLTNNNSIATISNAAGTNGTTYGISEGSFVVTASFGGVSTTANLTVTSATLVSISIGSNFNLSTGTSIGLTAIGTYSDGTTQNITSLVTWNTSSAANATVSNEITTKGTVNGIAAGTANITASLSGITSAPATATVGAPAVSNTSTATVPGYNVTLPNTMTVVQPSPSGDFSGVTYQGNPAEVAGFVSTVQYTGPAGCSAFGSTLISAMANDSPDRISSNIQISQSTIGTSPNCSSIYLLGVTTNTNMTVTELSNHLINVLGKSVPGGTVSNLPVSAGTEVAGNDFRVVLQATYSTTGNELVGIGVSRTANFSSNEAIINSLLDGTNILPAGSSKVSKSDTFVAAADPKVDFLWVVDNSGSMAGEQASVQNAATTFFNSLANKHLDYRLGVITTGSAGSNSCSRTLANHPSNKAWQLWGTGWTSAADGVSAFTSNTAVGTNGCGDESATFFAKYALENGVKDKNGNSAEIRNGAKVVIVIVSDEGDHYQCWTGGTKITAAAPTWNNCSGGTPLLDANNNNDNFFKQNNYKVYSIIGLDSSTGQPGKCTGTGSNAASDNNNGFRNYYDLAASTGGSSATICTDNFNPIMESITSSVAASSSSYVLSQTPISSSIIVKKDGVVVPQSTTDGWSYNSNSNSIVFSGSEWPAGGASIEVSYEYISNGLAMGGNDSSLTAYLFQATSNKSVRIGFGVILIAGLALVGRIAMRRKED